MKVKYDILRRLWWIENGPFRTYFTETDLAESKVPDWWLSFLELPAQINVTDVNSDVR